MDFVSNPRIMHQQIEYYCSNQLNKYVLKPLCNLFVQKSEWCQNRETDIKQQDVNLPISVDLGTINHCSLPPLSNMQFILMGVKGVLDIASAEYTLLLKRGLYIVIDTNRINLIHLKTHHCVLTTHPGSYPKYI